MTPFLLALATGGLIVGAFPPFSVAPAALIALTPLLVAIEGRGCAEAFVLGMVSGLVVCTCGFSWVSASIARFQGWPVSHAVPALLCFLLYHSARYALFAAGCRLLSEREMPPGRARLRTAVPVLAIAALWVGLEWGFPRVIPWTLGSALAGSAVLRQGAAVIGARGLSFVSLTVAALLASALRPGLCTARRLGRLAWVGALVTVLILYGVVSLHAYRGRDAGARRLRVAVVQGGLEPRRPRLPEANLAAWRRYAELSLPRSRVPVNFFPDLIVWPETVLRTYLREDDVYLGRVRGLVARLHSPLLLGALDRVPGVAGELNAAYAVTPVTVADNRSEAVGRGDLQVYYKRHLLAFAEYLPLKVLFPFAASWTTTGDFRSAGRRVLLRLPAAGAEREVRLGVSICIEAVRPGDFNAAVRDGAEVLVNLTDDGWFGDTAEPRQHLMLASLRAVETRRWLIRSSNSGVSAVINPIGDPVARLDTGAVGVIRYSVGLGGPLTFYARFGDAPLGVFMFLVLLVSVRLRRRRQGGGETRTSFWGSF